MTYEEVTKTQTYIKIKDCMGKPALEINLDTLADLLKDLAYLFNTDQISLEKRYITFKEWKAATMERPK